MTHVFRAALVAGAVAVAVAACSTGDAPPPAQQRPDVAAPAPAAPAETAESRLQQGVAAYRGGDHATALRHLMPAARDGHVRAQLLVGLIFRRGKDVVNDPALAARWFQRAVQQGNAQAMRELGALYRQGEGVEKDVALAHALFRLSLEYAPPEAKAKPQWRTAQERLASFTSRMAPAMRERADKRYNVLRTRIIKAAAPAAGAASAPQTASTPPPADGEGFPDTPVAVAYAKGEPRPDDVAVIIGNADYGKLGRDIPDVVPAYADAAGFKRYVVEALGVREGNVIDLRDATGAQMIRVFGDADDHRGQLFDWVKPGLSRVHVYYAGHGAPGDEGGAYLVPVDADAARIRLNGYALDTLYANLGKLPAESVTVVLEACFSGVSQGGSVVTNASPVYLKTRQPALPPHLTVVTAGAADQIASWEQDRSHSLFTRHFLEGMGGAADVAPHGNGDGSVDWRELRAYLGATVTYLARRYYGRDQTAQIVVGRGR